MDSLGHRARELRNNTTDAGRALWRALRGRQLEGFRFRRQVPVGGYIADFVCPQAKLIVELDGSQHAAQAEYDAARTERLNVLGYRVLRYWHDDVLLRPDALADDIHRQLGETSTGTRHREGTPPQPSPSLREREGVNSKDKGNDE